MNGISVAPLEDGDKEFGVKCSCEVTVAIDDDDTVADDVLCCSGTIVMACLCVVCCWGEVVVATELL